MIISSQKIIDWRKDKGKEEDHKTLINVQALNVCPYETCHDGNLSIISHFQLT